MEYHLEKKIKFNSDTENTSLYPWCLNEIDANGEKDGRDLIPFNWSLFFTGSSLKLFSEVSKRKEFDDKDEEIPTTIIRNKNAIGGVFHSGICRDGPFLTDEVSFSMMGTNRKIKDFEVYIVESNDENEDCQIFGIPSYDCEVDFRDETTQDWLQLKISLRPDRFAKIAEAIEAKKIDSADLYIGRVSGFYSEWSPSITPRFIKVLTAEHEIESHDDSQVKIPLVGKVGEFRLTLETMNKLNVKPDSQKFDFEKAFQEQELDPEYLDKIMKEAELIKEAEQLKDESNARLVADSVASNHQLFDQVISKLKIPLWFIFGVLVLILLK